MASGAKGVLNKKIAENIMAFKSLQRLKKAVLMYITTQTSEKEVSALRELFISLDKDGDGKLSVEEMQDAMKFYKGSTNIKEILDSIDTNKSGFIDYSEFLAATIDKDMYLSPEKLATAFRAFDKVSGWKNG